VDKNLPFLQLTSYMTSHSEFSPESRNPFSLFRIVQFKWLLASNLAFFFAMQAQMVMRAWLAFKLTNSGFALGTVVFTLAVPMFFLSPVGGMMADRIDRRNLIVIGQTAVFTLDFSIFLLLLTDHLQFWHLLLNAAIIGSAFPFIMPARNAIVVNIVGKSRLEQAMGINMGGMNMARILGPAIAGFLIDLAGVKVAYFLGVFLYGMALLCMFRVGSSKPMPDPRGLSPGKSILEALAYLRDNRLVLVLLLFGLVPMFLAMPFQNLLVVFADKIWQVGARGFGLLSASIGVGGIVGALWVVWIRNTYRRLRRMMLSAVAFGFFLFCFSFSPWFLLGLFLVFLANVFINIFSTLNNTAIQLLIPDRVRGRVTSFLMMSFSLPLLGTLPVSAVAEVYGAPFAVGCASLLAVLIALVFLLLCSNLRRMDELVHEARKVT